MIYSKNVIFNERVMYKDKHNTSANNSKLSGSIYVEMDDALECPTIESSQLEESIELG